MNMKHRRSIECGEVCVATRTEQFVTPKRLTWTMELDDTEERKVEQEMREVRKDFTHCAPFEKPKLDALVGAGREEERPKETSGAALSSREEIEKFLRDRSISQSLIATLLEVGFSEEFMRLLKAMGFSQEDVATLEQLWNIEAKDRGATDSIGSLLSSSGDYLSPDGIYLRDGVSKALTCALREIVAKKPSDPIEYLGHWLLNYKVCQEREKRLKELELELTIERERRKRKEGEDTGREESAGDACEEEEEYTDDWDFQDAEMIGTAERNNDNV